MSFASNKGKSNMCSRGIEPRFYRNAMGLKRFKSFVVGYKDSDLWIGIDPGSYHNNIPSFAHEQLIDLRKELESYILRNPEFARSMQPVELSNQAPQIAVEMAHAAKLANTGPMAAVAGAFSEYIATAIKNKFAVNEVVVENGGDIFMYITHKLNLSVYAGKSSFSQKIGLQIDDAYSPLAVCTSAATVGPSVSFGKADAVMVAAKNAAYADAFATAIGNNVKSKHSIEQALNIMNVQTQIISLLIICDENIGLKGAFQLLPIT